MADGAPPTGDLRPEMNMKAQVVVEALILQEDQIAVGMVRQWTNPRILLLQLTTTYQPPMKSYLFPDHVVKWGSPEVEPLLTVPVPVGGASVVDAAGKGT